MIFSSESDVTVVITCCGRIDLFRETLNSFFDCNTYPIKKIIITEDSGDSSVYSVVPEEYKQHFDIIINTKNLGQIRSIDNAYARVDTNYIFHCEEDWLFYRKSFIEDSKLLLESNNRIYQVWLRSFYHDIKRDYSFHSLGDDVSTHGINAYRLLSTNPKWQGFSFNPGLRRLSDYRSISGGYCSFLQKDKGSSFVESRISKHMIDQEMFAAILVNDAAAHIGYDHHIQNKNEKIKKRKKKIVKAITAISFFSLGWLFSFFLS